MKAKKPLLTISLLISNRPDTIPRCLDSLRLLMDKLPCELILIDTSKSEEIHTLLHTYTDQVYKFEWCKDFAKARNEGVRRANGEWFMYIDDDEWLDDVDQIVHFFKSNEYKKYECANIWVRNFVNTEYTRFTDNWVTRLFYLGKGAKFEGKIHESIYPIYGEPAFIDAKIFHSGYIFETEEKRRVHFERNSTLLLEAIEENPDNLRWRAQMVQEYRNIKEWELMYTFCKECLSRDIKLDGFMDRNHLCTFYAGLAEALLNLERHEEMLSLCSKALEDERSTELLKSHIYLRLAQNYVNMKQWDEAVRHIEIFLDRFKEFERNRDASREELGALLVHLTFEPQTVETAYNILIFSQLKKENLDADDLDLSEGEKMEVDAMSGLRFVRFMINLIATSDYRDVYNRFLSNACQDENLCNWACAEAQQWENKDEEAFKKIVFAFSKLDVDFWYIYYCHVIQADLNQEKTEVEVALKRLMPTLQNMFYMPDRVYEIIDKYGIKVAHLWNEMGREEWIRKASHLVNNGEDMYIDKVYDYIRDVYAEDDWRSESLPVALLEKSVKAGVQKTVLEYHDLLLEYAQRKIYLYNLFYEDGGNLELVYDDLQAALKIDEYGQIESENRVQALSLLKEAVCYDPELGHGISTFIRFYSELDKQRDARKKEEMDVLREEVIAQIKEMVSKKQYDAALQIASQLKQMFPEDLEVVELALEVRLKAIQ